MAHRFLIGCFAAGSLAALAAAGPASAQTDDYWSGLYIGANIGGAWGDTSDNSQLGNGTLVLPPADLAAINSAIHSSNNKTGFTGGIEAGYNYVTGSILLGIETDFQAMDVNQRKTSTINSGLLIAPPINYTITQRLTTDWLWTLRPRLGYVAGPWLLYATGGLATSKIKYTFQYADNRIPPNAVNASANDTKTGWTAGLGGAYAFTPNLSVKGEYLFTDFGNIRGTANTSVGAVQITSNVKVQANLLRLGVDWRF